MADGEEPEFDVAISFLSKDEPLAWTIAERLAPLKVFVYSKAQEKVVGRDGVEAFRDVFRHGCRVAMVLYRTGWGDTPWTAVEEIAIRDLCLENRFEPLMFVRLDNEGARPKWVPDSYLHLDFKTFGIADVAGATKAKCASLGIELKAPTAIDRARELAENARFEAETRDLKQSSPNPFREAQTGLNESLRQAADALRDGTGWEVAFGSDREATVFRANGVTVQFLVRDVYLNSCREGYFLMRVFDGALATPEEHQKGMLAIVSPSERSRQRIPLTRTKEFGWCWLVEGKTRSNDEVVTLAIEELSRGSQRSGEW